MKTQISVTLMCRFPQQLTNLWWDEDHFSNDQSKQVGRWVGKLSKEKKKPNHNLDSFFSPQKKNDEEKNDSIRNLRDLTTDQQRKKRQETENQNQPPRKKKKSKQTHNCGPEIRAGSW
jgi:uncharacterized protein YdaU (DUF1376 family)